ncbi:hypothetical protein ABO01nite_28890 [Asaia bogorensis NBRC 16594]|uniref:Uncharacterized protein n=2 Tax=Asaia bogorensis TaxID=91915 RepID=A0AAN4U3Y2_9PROT|nr:hypothetical protein ABO01nite_28890 [Asaia bogorensis NBRC 16594]
MMVNPYHTTFTQEEVWMSHDSCGCQGKLGFVSRARAEDAARSMRKRGKGAFGAYECDWCGFFHVGARMAGALAYSRALYGRPSPRCVQIQSGGLDQ